MTRDVVRVAVVQNSAGEEMARNLDECEALVREAAAAGATFIALPENCTQLMPSDEAMLEVAHPEESHPAIPRFSALAAELGTWLLVGSLTIRRGDGRLDNRSYLFDEQGRVRATYNKIHLFDVEVGDGQQYHESRTVAHGERAVMAETPVGVLGLTICYDLRFPLLYRALARAGATVLAVPAAFTRTTGRAHWEVLLRARAIENGCYVIAPDQCGRRPWGRETWGHSLIVDPWGEVLADAGEEPGFVCAGIDPGRVAEVRNRIPSLQHDRPFSGPVLE
ncbi:MAG: carbon-nitrogen hydrolase family protein [Gammaproteobacteria bacterium]|nr:MAG: carbon-nitrogen hydrolase family protein [Gammaproteobacteria bacterium]